ncbi:hypothetical protein JF545_12155 [Halomonas litopenaei]|nr:hypothetical protein [Halomonas litopenaei]
MAEIVFSCVEELRRTATRYDKLVRSFCAMIYLTCINRCLRADC